MKKKPPKSEITITTHEYTGEELRAQQMRSAEEKIRNFQKDAAGLYPHEILMLYYAPQYKIGEKEFQNFWAYEYAVKDPKKLLDFLCSRGFIRTATAKECIENLKLQELKDILKNVNLPVSGKKTDLISRIQESISEQELEAYITDRNYALTESGNQELKQNEYVPYMHHHKSSDISMSAMCMLVNKHPTIRYRDLLWGEFNRLSTEYAKHGKWGLYRNIKYTMHTFLMEEKKYSMAFLLLSEAFFYDLNGDASPFIASRLIKDFQNLEVHLDYTESKIREELGRIFKEMYVPHRNYSNDEVIKIIIAYSFGDKETANRIFNK